MEEEQEEEGVSFLFEKIQKKRLLTEWWGLFCSFQCSGIVIGKQWVLTAGILLFYLFLTEGIEHRLECR